jgi:hypothetical protein
VLHPDAAAPTHVTTIAIPGAPLSHRVPGMAPDGIAAPTHLTAIVTAGAPPSRPINSSDRVPRRDPVRRHSVDLQRPAATPPTAPTSSDGETQGHQAESATRLWHTVVSNG